MKTNRPNMRFGNWNIFPGEKPKNKGRYLVYLSESWHGRPAPDYAEWNGMRFIHWSSKLIVAWAKITVDTSKIGGKKES